MSISKGFLVDIDVTQPAPADSAIMRRRLLGIGLGGTAASLLPFLSGRAGATTPTGSTSSTTPATTTTAPPKRPTNDDVALLGFAQSVELAARDLYDVALGNTTFDDNQRAVIATIRESHDAYAASLSALLGRQAPQQVNPVFDELSSSFSGDAPAVLGAAYGLESAAVATHTEILGALRGIDGASLIASILIVEARHGTVLAHMNGATGLDDLLVDTEADALTPAEG
ncbi:MAG: ferritin-like domain-containing protein [Actinomycetota bacterium]|nr:ferritin-like domain-containing protein [Actinomycetota bacterium]